MGSIEGVVIGEPNYAGMVVSAGSTQNTDTPDALGNQVSITECLPFDAKNFLKGSATLTDADAVAFESTTIKDNPKLTLAQGKAAIAIVSGEANGLNDAAARSAKEAGSGVFFLASTGSQNIADHMKMTKSSTGTPAGNLELTVEDNGEIMIKKDEAVSGTYKYSIKLITV